MSMEKAFMKTMRCGITSRLARVALAMVIVSAASWGQSMQELKLTVGKSIVIDYPEDIGRISTSNPEIADYVAVSTREILLNAKAPGGTTLIVWSRTGQREFYSITVENNIEPFRKLLKGTFPDENIQILSSRDTVTLGGNVSTQVVSDRIAAMVAPLGKTVVNNMKLPPAKIEKQILLRVKFAEIDRNSGSAFGVSMALGGKTLTRSNPGGVTAPTFTGLKEGGGIDMSDLLNIFAFRPDLNFGVFVKNLQSKGLLQILAEPNLVTNNGQMATFLVGGEFPVPVLQGGSNSGSVTVQFKEFGVRLAFKPEITENNTIKIYIKPEVSTIDIANGVQFGGFTIPAIGTRRVETTLELGEGQSFVIGGLIDERVTETISKIPGLANIPLLGHIFKTRAENRNKTELIVLVTPEIVQPIGKNDPKPELNFPREFYRDSTFEKKAPISENKIDSAPLAPVAAAVPEAPKSSFASRLFRKGR